MNALSKNWSGIFLVVVIGTVISVAGSSQAQDYLQDHSGNDFNLFEVGNVDPIDDEFGEGVENFTSDPNAVDDEYLLRENHNDPEELGQSITIHVRANSTGNDNMQTFVSISDGNLTNGDQNPFLDIASNQDGDLFVDADNCDGTDDQEVTDDPHVGFHSFTVRIEPRPNIDGASFITLFVDGDLEKFAGYGVELCQSFRKDINIGIDSLHSLGAAADELYEVRIWNRPLSNSTIEEVASLSQSTRNGDELYFWTLGETDVTDKPVPPPEPVDFAEGLQDAAAAWGFRTSESQMFFAIAWIGITTVSVGVGTKLMSSGRTKNALIAGSALIVGVFFVFVEMLRFWQLATAAILAGFTIFGGPREVKNTWQEASRELVNVDHVLAQGGGDEETQRVPVDEAPETPEAPDAPETPEAPDAPETPEAPDAPEGAEAGDDAAEPAGGLEVTGAVPEPDLSPVTGQDASFVSDGGDE